MDDPQYYTPSGLEKLKEELRDLKSRGRADMARQISEARDKGDLSENAEYDAAKEAQGLLELRISKLETSVVNARLLDPDQVDLSCVRILSRVRIKHLRMNKEMTYQIVSEEEADLQNQKVSVKSPIGHCLMGKKKGDLVKIHAPAGTFEVEVLDISL